MTFEDMIMYEPFKSCYEKGMKESIKWNPIITRKLNDEEKEIYHYEEYDFIYDCDLPDDCEKVLVTTRYGDIELTTFYYDGDYFEGYEDEGDVLAWMRLPVPYIKEGINE